MKKLEHKLSKSERIIAKAKYSHCVFANEIIIAALLGGVIAVFWIFAQKIENFFTKTEAVKYLTDQNMKWAVLGAACFIGIVFLLHSMSYYRRETVLTETHLISMHGILNVSNFMICLVEIKSVESNQNIFQRIFKLGNLIVVSDAQRPYIIKNIVSPEKFASRIMRQSDMAKAGERNNITLNLTPKIEKSNKA